MKTILICKAGCVFRTRACPGNAAGEQGETEGIIRHLLKRNDINLVYFGSYSGEALCDTIIQPEIHDLSDISLGGYQRELWKLDIDNVKSYEPAAFIQIAGYSPTFSVIDNPNYVKVQAAAVRYTAPMHNICQHFEIPRIVINNDPRTYPKDQEMTLMNWDWCRPRALLDQRSKDWIKKVGGKGYKVRSLFSRCESWGYHIHRNNLHEDPCVVIAHNHFDQGITNHDPLYRHAWRHILQPMLPENTHVYGNGWPEDGKVYQGCVSPEDVLDLFQMHTCGPVVSHTHGFYTGKPYVMMSQGCIPLLHLDYDEYELLMPEEIWDTHGFRNTYRRLAERGDLARMAYELHSSSERYEEAFDHWTKALKPDWTILDQLVDSIVEDRFVDNAFGGYLPLH